MIERKYNLNLCLAVALAAILLTLFLGTLQNRLGIFDGADATAIEITKSIRTGFLTQIMRAITFMGDEMGLMPVVCVIFWLGFTTEAITFLLMLVFGAVINWRMKEFFELARPSQDAIEWLSHADGYGYPSGHTQNGALYVWLIYAFVNKYWYLCLLAGVLMGVTRIYLGVHNFSDTVGGLICGLGITVAATGIYCHIRDLKSLRESIEKSLALRVLLSVGLSVVYLVFAWGYSAAFKYAGLLAGLFIAYSSLGFRWRLKNPRLFPIAVIVGLGLVLAIRGGLKAVLPVSDFSDYFRYFASGVLLGGSPWVFVKASILEKREEESSERETESA